MAGSRCNIFNGNDEMNEFNTYVRHRRYRLQPKPICPLVRYDAGKLLQQGSHGQLREVQELEAGHEGE